jgi:Ca-activated chloride channel family protein
VLVEALGREAFSQYRAAADSLAAEGSTNFTGGLLEACSVARESLGKNRPQGPAMQVRMVLVTDGLLDLDPATAERVQKQLTDAAHEKIRLDVIDLGQQQKDADPQLTAMSKAGQGGVHRATSAEQVRWALREIVTGRPQLVARAARLHITFNPKAVLEYRIIGHESGDWAGMLPGSVDADFREGQAATGLFEVRLAPNGPRDIAAVELTWYLPDGERTLFGTTQQRIVAPVRRQQFAAERSKSAPWLQQATVAAYTAEVLRRSPFIFARHPDVKQPKALHRAHEMALDVDSSVAQKPSYQEFVELIRQEMKAQPSRRPVKE